MNQESDGEYPNFETLRRFEKEGRDFRIEWRPRPSSLLVMAPHGGRIEFMTAELAGEIAGSVFSCYKFMGIKSEGNGRLHLTSRVFDEPVGVKAARSATTVLTIHGRKGDDAETVMVGGRDADLRRALTDNLVSGDFRLAASIPGLGGIHPQNICNRCASGRGAQLELSASLRRRFRRDGSGRRRFAEAVRRAAAEGAKKG